MRTKNKLQEIKRSDFEIIKKIICKEYPSIADLDKIFHRLVEMYYCYKEKIR